MKRELVDFLKQEFSNRLFDQRSEGTRCISNAIVGWAKVNSLKVFSEYRMPKEFIYHKRKGGPLERPAIIDFVIKKSETSLYIELDSSQKKWSVAKLQQIKNAGGDVLWIRWNIKDNMRCAIGQSEDLSDLITDDVVYLSCASRNRKRRSADP